jgi:hypothetical protein
MQGIVHLSARPANSERVLEHVLVGIALLRRGPAVRHFRLWRVIDAGCP